MPVEQLKVVNTTDRSTVQAVQDLAELLLKDADLHYTINDYLANKDYDEIDVDTLQEIVDTFTDTVDRIVVFDDVED